MAKSDNKKDLNPSEGGKSDVVVAPAKVTEAAQKSEEAQTAAKPQEYPKKAEKTESQHNKRQGWRKFVFFIFLLLLGGLAFLAVQLEQTRKLNEEALQKLQATYNEKITILDDKVNILNREVSALKERPIVEHAAGVSENLLNRKIDALRDEIFAQLSQNTTPADGLLPKKDNEKISNESDLTAKEQSQILLAPEVAALAKNEKKTQEVLLASGAIIVRDLAEQGVSFAYEAEVLQILARGNELAENYVRAVRKFANTGITGKHKLVREFSKIFAELNNTNIKPSAVPVSEEGTQVWYEKIWKWLKQAVAVKKGVKKPIFVAQNDEVADLVNEGRLQDALNALKISDKYSQLDSKPLDEWKEQTKQYLEFNQAVSGLIMNALANIRLKELEHAAE